MRRTPPLWIPLSALERSRAQEFACGRYAMLVDQEFYYLVEEQRLPGGALDGAQGQAAAIAAFAKAKEAKRAAEAAVKAADRVC